MIDRPRAWRRVVGLLLVACALCAAPQVLAQETAVQPSTKERETSLANARNHGAEGARFEQARNYRAAMDAYRRAIRELSLQVERSAPGAKPTLPFEMYWTIGSARLDLARVWVLSGLTQGASRVEQARFLANLASAKEDLLDALTIDTDEASAAGKPSTPRRWKIHSALAWQAILDGDGAAARNEAQLARSLNPDHPYAAAIDRALASLAPAPGDGSAPAQRSEPRPQPAYAEDVVASLKSVIDVGNFVAAAAPSFGTAVATRGSAQGVPCPTAFTGTCYPVWFGTNRKPIDPSAPAKGFSGEYDDEMRFGKRIVFIPTSHRPGEIGSPLWKRLLTQTDDRIEVGPSTSLTEQTFAREIREFLGKLDPNDRNVLVYIHGFNTSFDDAARRAAQLGFDLKVPGVTAFYSWPSRASARDYSVDVESIEASEEHIAQFLVKVSALANRGNVHIIAHSMGNRGLLRALHRATAQAAIRSGVRFGKIFLAAPDVDSKLFRQLASIYPQISERTTLYVADQDKALAALEWFGRDPRAGSVPPLLLIPGIDTIRVRGASLFRLGHSYVAEDVDVIRDISTALYGKDPPAKRGERNGWPIPDPEPERRGAWVIGK
jgi:esterase/lipase superfamily enzyme